MLKAGLILSFLLLGKVSCYSEGARLGPFCENMDIDHPWSGAPEVGQRPFQIKIVHNGKEFFDYVHLNGGDEVEVALISEIDIRGFMMDGRDEEGNPAGFFVRLEQPDRHTSLDCKGRPNTTMTQRDNRAQRRISGRWTTLSPGLFTFNAAVVANGNYWKRKTIVLPSTTPEPTLHQWYQQVADVAFLISHFLNLWGALFLLGCNRESITRLAHRLFSLLSLCAASVALVFSLLCADLNVFAVTGVVVFLSLTQTIITFTLCEPNHELRDIMMLGLRTLAAFQTALTVAAIFMDRCVRCDLCGVNK